MVSRHKALDAVVVGAGPAGSVLAEALARESFRVALLEEHRQVGYPDHCSGLVSPRTLQAAQIPEEAVGLARYDRARVWGPSGDVLWVRSNTVQAVAIDRPRFDQILATRAVDAGAHLMLGMRARDFERVNGHVSVKVLNGGQTAHTLRATLLVGADGASSGVAKWLGGARAEETIPAIKAEADFQGKGTNSIEIFVGGHVAPGWFGWVIPLPNRAVRIGVGATCSVKRCFNVLCDLIRDRFGPLAMREVKSAPIPLGPARGFVGERVMLVGAAAGHTKPTTGGGVYLSVRAAQMAAEVAAQALARGDCSYRALRVYEQAWYRHQGHDIAIGHILRMLYRQLSDRALDTIISLFKEPWAQGLLSRYGDLDHPAQLFSALLGVVGRRPPASASLSVLTQLGQVSDD